MCDFISWIEKDRQIFYLTYKDIYQTSRGKELRNYCKNPDDYVGHGAIRFFYADENGNPFEGGEEKECTDFSSPDNFPKEIVSDIIKGRFRGLGISEQLLNQPAWAEYEKIRQSALAEYEKIDQSALAEYEKIDQSAWAEYEKIDQSAWAEYEKIRQSALVECEKIRQSALVEYEKIRQSALVEYEKIRQSAFWNIFLKSKNMNHKWK